MSEFVNLSNFFAVFVALNFAYSGSKWFRIAIDKDLLDLQKTLNDLTQTAEALIQSSGSLPDSEPKRDLISSIKAEFYALQQSRENNLKFERQYHKIFLSSGLFCLVIILLIGLGTIDNKIWSDFSITIISYSFLITIVMFYIFLSGFTNKVDRPLIPTINKAPLSIILILIYSFAFSCAYINYKIFPIFPSRNVYECIGISIGIAILPYILFFSKAIAYKVTNIIKCNKFSTKIEEFKEKIKELDNVPNTDVDKLASQLEQQIEINESDKDTQQ
ncbi:hypothetical protein D3C87_297720 [compost metagenome]